jgi:predicted transcriptional regulator
MELHLTAEQEAHLSRIAQHEGKRPEQLATEHVLTLLEEHDSFRQAVQQGLAEANAGLFIEEEEMDARFETMMRG